MKAGSTESIQDEGQWQGPENAQGGRSIAGVGGGHLQLRDTPFWAKPIALGQPEVKQDYCPRELKDGKEILNCSINKQKKLLEKKLTV